MQIRAHFYSVAYKWREDYFKLVFAVHLWLIWRLVVDNAYVYTVFFHEISHLPELCIIMQLFYLINMGTSRLFYCVLYADQNVN